MQATRSFSYTEVMPSQASQLPHWICMGLQIDVNQYHRASPGGRFLKRFMLHMYWLG